MGHSFFSNLLKILCIYFIYYKDIYIYIAIFLSFSTLFLLEGMLWYLVYWFCMMICTTSSFHRVLCLLFFLFTLQLSDFLGDLSCPDFLLVYFLFSVKISVGVFLAQCNVQHLVLYILTIIPWSRSKTQTWTSLSCVFICYLYIYFLEFSYFL